MDAVAAVEMPAVVVAALALALAVKRHWVCLWQEQPEFQCPETLLFWAFSSSFSSEI